MFNIRKVDCHSHSTTTEPPSCLSPVKDEVDTHSRTQLSVSNVIRSVHLSNLQSNNRDEYQRTMKDDVALPPLTSSHKCSPPRISTLCRSKFLVSTEARSSGSQSLLFLPQLAYPGRIPPFRAFKPGTRLRCRSLPTRIWRMAL